jgi:hypothetical protein
VIDIEKLRLFIEEMILRCEKSHIDYNDQYKKEVDLEYLEKLKDIIKYTGEAIIEAIESGFLNK